MDEEFTPIQSEEFIAIERFNIDELERIGKGSDRIVFRINEKLALKVVTSARGIAQNDLEGDFLLSFIPEVFERGLDYVVVELVDRDDKRSNAFLKPIKKFSVIDFDNKTSEIQDALNKLDEQHDGFSDVMNYDLLWKDFIAGRNWGWKNNKPFHIDAGTLNKSILNVNDFHKTDWEIIKSKRRSSKNKK